MSARPAASEATAASSVQTSPEPEYDRKSQTENPIASRTEREMKKIWNALRDTVIEDRIRVMEERKRHQHGEEHDGQQKRGVDDLLLGDEVHEIGRASCRERV